MVVRKSVKHTALSGSQSFKPPALPVVTDCSVFSEDSGTIGETCYQE
jgi:hypothetical protein